MDKEMNDKEMNDKEMNDKEMNHKLLLAIRLYEINKDIHLFKTFLDSLNIETNLKNQIIKSTLDIVGV
jgi:hypothetical protein